MKRFIAKFADRITGVLSGFDRLVFRGTLRKIAFVAGLSGFLWRRKVLLKDFGSWAQDMTHQIKAASRRAADALDVPVEYLPSSQIDKEAKARTIAERDGVKQGLVAVLTCLEPCPGFDIHRNAEAKKLELVSRPRKGLVVYHYAIDPVFGWMNARIQTWLPFNIQICLNGREWLARQMNEAGIAYRQVDNCFPWIADLPRAQALMDRQLRTNWPQRLDAIARRLNPDHNVLFPNGELDYYWSAYQSEWADDLLFRDAASLAEIYPALVRHGMNAFSSQDVLRFLGRKPHWNLQKEIQTSFKDRIEGVRIKHEVGNNSVKMYDKAHSILRLETTIQDPSPFKVYRATEGDPQGPKKWRPMRKGIADVARRAKVSSAANERYAEAMAAADTSTSLAALVAEVNGPVRWGAQRLRALRPWDAEELRLFRAVSRGEWCVHGFRNRDLQEHLFDAPAQSSKEQRRRTARVTRLIRLLRAHRLIHKESGAHRYTVSPRGRDIITPILAAQAVTLEQLRKLAA